jgi:hypothetical protein
LSRLGDRSASLSATQACLVVNGQDFRVEPMRDLNPEAAKSGSGGIPSACRHEKSRRLAKERDGVSGGFLVARNSGITRHRRVTFPPFLATRQPA